ncbi:hypothetical protein L596_001204 [Steinernema carpocapsae]|uniref:Uncharacterized protein n=1 Tax=Steinernema carpocapsae TaxID=34508 RepID=A0A4U8UPL9_STECR|nr:hypothetical protein L596_001204 [Steinernema carpocapsae]
MSSFNFSLVPVALDIVRLLIATTIRFPEFNVTSSAEPSASLSTPLTGETCIVLKEYFELLQATVSTLSLQNEQLKREKDGMLHKQKNREEALKMESLYYRHQSQTALKFCNFYQDQSEFYKNKSELFWQFNQNKDKQLRDSEKRETEALELYFYFETNKKMHFHKNKFNLLQIDLKSCKCTSRKQVEEDADKYWRMCKPGLSRLGKRLASDAVKEDKREEKKNKADDKDIE